MLESIPGITDMFGMGDTYGDVGGALGINRIPGTSPFFPDPAEAEYKKTMEEVQQMYAEQNTMMQAAKMQALQQAMGLWNPYNQALGSMMGLQGPAVPLEGALQNPLEVVAQTPQAPPTPTAVPTTPAPAPAGDALAAAAGIPSQDRPAPNSYELLGGTRAPDPMQQGNPRRRV